MMPRATRSKIAASTLPYGRDRAMGRGESWRIFSTQTSPKRHSLNRAAARLPPWFGLRGMEDGRAGLAIRRGGDDGGGAGTLTIRWRISYAEPRRFGRGTAAHGVLRFL